MSNSRIAIRCARPLIAMMALGFAWAAGLAPAIAADGRSSPEDRARFVAITHKLEAAPLQPDARADRAWAVSWLTEAPDISVTVCLTSLGFTDEHYPYSGEILLQYAFSMATLVIEHPETARDLNAQQLAGAEGALRAYRSILGTQPDAKSPALDALLETQARGELPAFIGKDAEHCTAKK